MRTFLITDIEADLATCVTLSDLECDQNASPEALWDLFEHRLLNASRMLFEHSRNNPVADTGAVQGTSDRV